MQRVLPMVVPSNLPPTGRQATDSDRLAMRATEAQPQSTTPTGGAVNVAAAASSKPVPSGQTSPGVGSTDGTPSAAPTPAGAHPPPHPQPHTHSHLQHPPTHPPTHPPAYPHPHPHPQMVAPLPPNSAALPLPHQPVAGVPMAMPGYVAQMPPQLPLHLAQQMASQLNVQFPMPNLIPIPSSATSSSNPSESSQPENADLMLSRTGKPLRNTKRAAQNRNAQKAFRQRRERYIKDLEVKSKEFDRLDAQVAALSQENETLKNYVLELEQRFGIRRPPA
ncbi:LADA_0G01244g1_1 [Lachancea dasiensis]|uniref:LADA_0G01244g1_1 n=1 Tax=Lachancea dasiensis TaxID=1072105 RepID=A0A1G4JQN6_9SACH|nr:LADA_0G01244g1_1 [Lachancea dasiensis]